MVRQHLLRLAAATSLVFAPLLPAVACSASSSTPSPSPASSASTDAGNQGPSTGGPDSSVVDTGMGVVVTPEASGGGEDVVSSGMDAGAEDAAVQEDAPPVDDSSTGMADGGSIAGKHVYFVWGYGEHLATPKPTDTLEPLDVHMKALLEARGLVVDLAVDALSTVADATGKALMVISSSVNRNNLTADGTQNGTPRFRNLAVPAIVMKDGVIEVMGLGVGSSGGFSTGLGQTQITIIKPGDPLAAGLTGNVTVYTTMGGQVCPMCYTGHVMNSDRIIYSFPTAAANSIATIVGQPTQKTIFAYAAGAMMAGGFVAPAKRMGFFIHRDTVYGPNGDKLFDAAVDYLLAP